MRFRQNLIGLVLIIQYLDVSPENGQVTYCRVRYSAKQVLVQNSITRIFHYDCPANRRFSHVLLVLFGRIVWQLKEKDTHARSVKMAVINFVFMACNSSWFVAKLPSTNLIPKNKT